MAILTLLFGLLSGCLLAVLVGIIGSRRRIGFGLAFLLSLIFTPLVGLIITLLTDPLPGGVFIASVKKVNPILLIALSAAAGILIYYVF